MLPDRGSNVSNPPLSFSQLPVTSRTRVQLGLSGSGSPNLPKKSDFQSDFLILIEIIRDESGKVEKLRNVEIILILLLICPRFILNFGKKIG